MIGRIKFNQTEKAVVGVLSVVALGAGMTVIGNQPVGQAFAVENTQGDQQFDSVVVGETVIATTNSDSVLTQIDAPASEGVDPVVSSEPDQSVASNDSQQDQDNGSVTKNVTVTVDGKDVDPESMAENGISVSTNNTGTLDDSDNSTDVSVDQSTSQDQQTRNRVRNRNNIDANVGNNDVSGNLNPVTVHNGNVKINFSLPK